MRNMFPVFLIISSPSSLKSLISIVESKISSADANSGNPGHEQTGA
jgi:hypothetical protein